MVPLPMLPLSPQREGESIRSSTLRLGMPRPVKPLFGAIGSNEGRALPRAPSLPQVRRVPEAVAPTAGEGAKSFTLADPQR